MAVNEDFTEAQVELEVLEPFIDRRHAHYGEGKECKDRHSRKGRAQGRIFGQNEAGDDLEYYESR